MHRIRIAFFVRCLDSIIPLLARPNLVSVAEQAGLSLKWSLIPKIGFLVTWLMYEPPHDKTDKMTCAHNRTAWTSAKSDHSSLCAQRVAKGPSFLHADSEDSDQTWRMPRLICVFARRNFVAFVVIKFIIMYNKLMGLFNKTNLFCGLTCRTRVTPPFSHYQCQQTQKIPGIHPGRLRYQPILHSKETNPSPTLKINIEQTAVIPSLQE